MWRYPQTTPNWQPTHALLVLTLPEQKTVSQRCANLQQQYILVGAQELRLDSKASRSYVHFCFVFTRPCALALEEAANNKLFVPASSCSQTSSAKNTFTTYCIFPSKDFLYSREACAKQRTIIHTKSLGRFKAFCNYSGSSFCVPKCSLLTCTNNDICLYFVPSLVPVFLRGLCSLWRFTLNASNQALLIQATVLINRE